MTPPSDQLRGALRRIDAGQVPVPDDLSAAATYAVVSGLVDLDTMSLTDQGRRVLAILGGEPR